MYESGYKILRAFSVAEIDSRKCQLHFQKRQEIRIPANKERLLMPVGGRDSERKLFLFSLQYFIKPSVVHRSELCDNDLILPHCSTLEVLLKGT